MLTSIWIDEQKAHDDERDEVLWLTGWRNTETLATEICYRITFFKVAHMIADVEWSGLDSGSVKWVLNKNQKSSGRSEVWMA